MGIRLIIYIVEQYVNSPYYCSNANVVLAPMAGVTDITYRTICKEMGAGLVHTEMISAKGLYYQDKKTEDLMKINENNRPVSVQIFGSDPDIMS
jgi:tRNA-dihydrouridine synthase B